MSNNISVLLVDDHSLVRRGFRRLLEDEPDIAVVGEAGDGAEAVRLAQELKPDVIVMDCAMPGTSGLIATRQILQTLPSSHPDAEHAFGGNPGAPGARGGSSWLRSEKRRRPGIAGGDSQSGGRGSRADPQVSRPGALKGERNGGLTVRELEILQLIVDGKSNKEIADQLGLSANTVAVHRANTWTRWEFTRPRNWSFMRSATGW